MLRKLSFQRKSTSFLRIMDAAEDLAALVQDSSSSTPANLRHSLSILGHRQGFEDMIFSRKTCGELLLYNTKKKKIKIFLLFCSLDGKALYVYTFLYYQSRLTS